MCECDVDADALEIRLIILLQVDIFCVLCSV
jgi:hypothetical protein